MTTTRMLSLVAAALLVTACGSSDSDCRDAETLWSIDADGVDCDGAYVQADAPLDPPYLYHSCVWHQAYVGDSGCGTVTAEFSRASSSSAWELDGYWVTQ